MLYARIGAVLLVFALGLTGGWKVQAWRFASIEAKRLADEREASRANAMRADKAAESHEEARTQLQAEVKIITKEVERVVERPVYRNVCLDADGLRLLERAIGQHAPAAGEPARALPAAEQPQ